MLAGESLTYIKLFPEILEELERGGPNPIRPNVPKTPTYHEAMLNLMRQCWEEYPQDRPNISQIRGVIFSVLGR